MAPTVLETACEWRAENVADPAAWTEQLSAAEVAEIDAAIAHARAKSPDLLDIEKADFPLPTLGKRLKAIERELMDGRGFESRIDRLLDAHELARGSQSVATLA